MKPIALNSDFTFAAIQVGRMETPDNTISELMFLAEAHNCLFKTLELFGPITLGPHKFLRFRFDCLKYKTLHEASVTTKRGFVSPGKSGVYEATIITPSGPREGTVEPMTMLAAPLMGQHKSYRGPSAEFWQRQFK